MTHRGSNKPSAIRYAHCDVTTTVRQPRPRLVLNGAGQFDAVVIISLSYGSVYCQSSSTWCLRYISRIRPLWSDPFVQLSLITTSRRSLSAERSHYILPPHLPRHVFFRTLTELHHNAIFHRPLLYYFCFQADYVESRYFLYSGGRMDSTENWLHADCCWRTWSFVVSF